MEFKTKKPNQLKVGDRVKIGYGDENIVVKITGIIKRKGAFIAGTVYNFKTDHYSVDMFYMFGPHFCEGRKYPADTIEVAIG